MRPSQMLVDNDNDSLSNGTTDRQIKNDEDGSSYCSYQGKLRRDSVRSQSKPSSRRGTIYGNTLAVNAMNADMATAANRNSKSSLSEVEAKRRQVNMRYTHNIDQAYKLTRDEANQHLYRL